MRNPVWTIAAGLLLAAVIPAAAAPPAEVAADHWSYEAIRDLVRRGLVSGYRDARALEGRTLTRYEVASLVKRAVDNLIAIPVPAPGESAAAETPGTAASRGQGYQAPPAGRRLVSGRPGGAAAFREADLPTVKRLVDEYSVELAVIGTDLQGFEQKLHDLAGRVEKLESTVNDPKGPLQTAINSLARIDKIRFSGYLQARYQSFQDTSEANNPPGTRDPQPAATDGFAIRRLRLVLQARPTARTGVRWQVDGAGGSVATRDAWIDYFFNGNPAKGPTATIGQMKVPFGFEVVQSSSVRETPERARVTRFFFPDERDRGLKVATATGRRWFGELGVFQGIQLGSRTGINATDNNNDKNLSGRLRTTVANGRLDAGVSLDLGTTLRTAGFPDETGISAAVPKENPKIAYGVDLQWLPLDGTVLRAEGILGKATGSRAAGYIVTLVQNVGKKNQFVAKYDWFGASQLVLAPVGPAGDVPGAYGSLPYSGTLSTWHLGWIRQLDSSTRLKLFYELHGRGRETVAGAPFPWLGNLLRVEVITLF